MNSETRRPSQGNTRAHSGRPRRPRKLLLGLLLLSLPSCSRDALPQDASDVGADSAMRDAAMARDGRTRDTGPLLGTPVTLIRSECPYGGEPNPGKVCLVHPKTIAKHDLNDVAYVGNELVAVGNEGTVVAGGWGKLSGEDLENVDLRRVRAVGELALIVGDKGTVLRYAHQALTHEPTDTKARLNGVWSDADSRAAWAVGAKGTILRRKPNGSWHTASSPTTEDLEDVWGAGPQAVFAVGAGGTFLRYDGSSWRAIATPASVAKERFQRVYGRSASEVYAVSPSGTLLRYDGTHARLAPGPSPGGDHIIVDLWSDDRYVYALSSPKTPTPKSTSSLLYFHGTSWQPYGPPVQAALLAAAAPTKKNSSFFARAVGRAGAVASLQSFTSGWEFVYPPHERRSALEQLLYGQIAANEKMTLWAVGTDHDATHFTHYARSRWLWRDPGTKNLPENLHQLLFDLDDYPVVLASEASAGTGQAPRALWRCLPGWTKHSLTVQDSIAAAAKTAAGDFLLLISYEKLLRRAGHLWENIPNGQQAHPLGTPTHLWGTSAQQVHVMGTKGASLQAHVLEGGQWLERALPQSAVDARVLSMWGRSENEVYAATSKGLLRWDGTTWSIALAPSPEPLVSGVWGPRANSRLYAIGPKTLHILDGATVRAVPATLEPHESMLSITGTEGSQGGWDPKDAERVNILTSQKRIFRYQAP